jgi:hypothetical protein
MRTYTEIKDNLEGINLLFNIESIFNEYEIALTQEQKTKLEEAQRINKRFKHYSTIKTTITKTDYLSQQIYLDNDSVNKDPFKQTHGEKNIEIKKAYSDLKTLVDLYMNQTYKAGILDKVIPYKAKLKKDKQFKEIADLVLKIVYK